MKIGESWKRRLKQNEYDRQHSARMATAALAAKRARETIQKLRRSLAQARDHRCLVMELDRSETVADFNQFYGVQIASSEGFLGAAKTVVEFCLENELDVYVWESEFKMTGGCIGAEIWVTPRGVPYHPANK